MMQSDLTKVGLKVDIVSSDWAEYLKRSQEIDRDGAVILGSTEGIADPDNFLAALLGREAIGSGNRANRCNQDFEKFVRAAKLTTDEQAQSVFKQQAPG